MRGRVAGIRFSATGWPRKSSQRWRVSAEKQQVRRMPEAELPGGGSGAVREPVFLTVAAPCWRPQGDSFEQSSPLNPPHSPRGSAAPAPPKGD